MILAFVAAPRPAASQRYKRQHKNQKDREHRWHQRRRCTRRGTCGETMEDTSSTSSDERIKSKTRMRRERRAQKYTTTIYCHHLVLPSPPLCPSTCQLHPQMSAQVRASPVKTWTADVARPLCEERPQGPHSGGCAGVRLGEAQNPGPTEHERITQKENPPRAEPALTRRETQYQGARTPSREEFRNCN